MSFTSFAFNLSSHESAPISCDYVPCEADVICGRGAECFNHIGNKMFRQMVEDNLDLYRRSKSKFEKSIIICQVVNSILNKSTIGGFVKKDVLTGQYIKLDYFTAREKTSQAFRDANTRTSSKIVRRSSPLSALTALNMEQIRYPEKINSTFDSFSNSDKKFLPMESSFDNLVEHVCCDLPILTTDLMPLHPLSSSISELFPQDDSKDKSMEKVLEDLEIFSNENLSQNKLLWIRPNRYSIINLCDDDIQTIWSEWSKS